jgi:hypothetical protein
MAKPKASSKRTEPKPVVFEHVQQKSAYEQLAERVLAAVKELNAALQAAHELAEMRVLMKITAVGNGRAMTFHPQIYKLTHATINFSIVSEEAAEKVWQQVKDPAFQDVAGQGFEALRSKRSATP